MFYFSYYILRSKFSVYFVSVAAELTLVLVGDTNSMKTGSQNILFDHDKQVNVEQISEGLYDLCGRHISVINLLGHQNSETCPLNKGVHAFILLVSNSHHESSYRAGRQWLEKAFGEESLPYLLTVVTHESDEQCKSALTNLKGDDGFNDTRYHTCKKGMTDQREMMALLEKVDVMVQENNPSCYTRPKCEGAHEEDKIKSSEFQGNQQCKFDRERERDEISVNYSVTLNSKSNLSSNVIKTNLKRISNFTAPF